MNPRIDNWLGKRVWIIGASSGIGAASARLLWERGAKVAVSARRRDMLQQLVAGRLHALALPCDVTQPDTLAAARDALLARWDGIDLLICAAGLYAPMRADQIDIAAADRLIDVNYKGVLHSVATVLPAMLDQGHGAIAVVSSVAGYSGLPQALAYGPTKAALINLCETLYLDLAPRGIGVHLVNPGFVATPMTAANEFPMPALMTPDAAARALVDGIARGAFHIHFPKRFTNWLRLARLLPYRLYFPLVRRVTGL